MRPEPVAYQDLISSLADGTPVDWAGLEDGAKDEHERRRYRNLRLVARVAELHRTLTLDEEPVDAAPADRSMPPPATWGRLQVGARLASGSFGDLYRAHDPQLDRDVALKLLHPGLESVAATRLLFEGQALARVSHPNVVVVHGADVSDGRAGLWMELIDGQTLAEVARERGRFGADETIGIGRDLCRALAAVHGAGIVHSDVKAHNVMREAGGRIVLMDFGSGRRKGVDSPVAGTPLYFAPEVLAGSPPTPQSDIYSLGVLLFELLTSTYPYVADDLGSLRGLHAAGTRTHLRDLRPDLPDPLVDAVERALDADPALRFPTAGAMEQALARAQVPAAAPRWRRAGIVPLLIGVAALVTWLLVWPRTTAGPSVRSLALLAFASPDAASAHLIDGLSVDVIRELRRFDVQVKTATAESVLAAGGDLDARLGADAIVAADVRRQGAATGLGVTVRRAGQAPFWTKSYDILDAQLPSTARTIAQDIAQAIGAASRTGAAPPYQASYRAYDAYQRGRLKAEGRTEEELQQSLEAFREAAKIEPGYAAAWAGMAGVYLTLGVPPFGTLRPMEARTEARRAAERALALDPNLAEGETALAWLAALYDWDWPTAEARFRNAIRLNPQHGPAYHWYSMFLTDMGRFDEARVELRKAQALEPLSLLYQRDFGWIDFFEAKYDDAIVHLRNTLASDSKYSAAITLLARSLGATGRTEEALAELERARPDISSGSYLSFRGYIEAAAGDPRARQTLAELTDVGKNEYVTPYYFALIHTALGQRDHALAALQLAYSQQDSTLGSINVDPRFDPIRSDERFQAIVRAMRFPQPRR